MSTYVSKVLTSCMVSRVDEDPLDHLVMRRYGFIPLHSAASATAPTLSPESTSFVERYAGVPVTLLLSLLSCMSTSLTQLFFLMNYMLVSMTQFSFLLTSDCSLDSYLVNP